MPDRYLIGGDKLRRTLRDLPRKQIPFATALGLTRTAQRAVRERDVRFEPILPDDALRPNGSLNGRPDLRARRAIRMSAWNLLFAGSLQEVVTQGKTVIHSFGIWQTVVCPPLNTLVGADGVVHEIRSDSENCLRTSSNQNLTPLLV